MVTPKKITEKEWRQYIEPKMRSFTRAEKDAARSAFYDDLQDVDQGEIKPLFGQSQKGITPEELKKTTSALRDRNSVKSRGLRVQLSDEHLNELERALNEAMEDDKERWF